MRVTLAFALLLVATAAASAQTPSAYPPPEPPPPSPADERQVPVPDEPAAPAPSEPLFQTVIVDQFYSGIGASKRMLIRTGEEWRGFWREMYGDEEPIPTAPVIDFETSMVVVAALGTRPTEGYWVEIESVLASEEGIQVKIIETAPGEGCVVNEALTSPVTAVAVERSEGQVTFIEREEVRPCG
jgi:hypothetical protein